MSTEEKTVETAACKIADGEEEVDRVEARRIAGEELAEARRLAEEQIAELPLEDREAIREAQAELTAQGVEVHAVAYWWGFEIYLNAEAAKLAAQITKIIGAVVSKLPPLKPIAPIIKAYFELRALWIKQAGDPHGCKLVSPWVAPGMLIPIPLGRKEDTSLWWTVFEPEQGWTNDKKFTAHHSGSHPALAEFQGRLYCVHRGYGGDDNHLWWTVYDPKKGWSDDTKFPGHTSADGPALAVFGGKLHCVHRGGGSDSSLWHTTFDGTDWSADTKLPHHTSNSNPALAVFGGKLHCVHRGSSDTNLWHTTFDGASWSSDTKLTQHLGMEGPGLAVFDNKLYCVHRGSEDQHLWWAAYDGGSWSSDQRLPGHASVSGPAVIAYRDSNGTRDQLLVIHRGHG
ncbi:hypothetical protein [Streptomyces luteireticuli]|uniref:hypothetical protein n=1 Tax=Streptomyces luteireticuli TaxID=173858 RepID=UPI00355758C9